MCELPHFSTPPHIPTHFLTTSILTPYTLPHLPPFILTSTTPPLRHSTLPHSFPMFSHFFHIPPYLTQLLKLPKIPQFLHHSYSPKFSILPYPPPILSHTRFIINPHQNFSLCSFIAKFSLAITQGTLKTPSKFHKKNLKIKIKNGYTTSKLF